MKKYLIPVIYTVMMTLIVLADDYGNIVAGGETKYEIQKETVIKVVQTTVPVGGNIADKTDGLDYKKIFISSISADEISIGHNNKYNSNSSGTDSCLSLGRCKINTEIVVRFDNTKPAIRIKLLSVNMENGTATLIVTKFWPYPNSAQTKEVDQPTNPEAVPTMPDR